MERYEREHRITATTKKKQKKTNQALGPAHRRMMTDRYNQSRVMEAGHIPLLPCN